MNKNFYQRLTGALFISGAVLVNIPYALLVANFNYPVILREPTGFILNRFHEGGTGLILTWFAFAWVGFPLLFAIVMLQKILERDNVPYLWFGTVVGVIGGIAQMVGLLRWVFVVPILAKTYTDPSASAIAKESVAIVFQIVHQYGGVVVGEHIGQAFSILWMFTISFVIFQLSIFKRWLAWFGFLASGVYVLAQTELFATVIFDFPVVPEAGLIGSLLWLIWMIVLGVFLIKSRIDTVQ